MNQPYPVPSDLSRLARSINEREALLLALEKRTLDDVAEWLREAILQGNELNRVHAQLKNADWLDWLKAHCPELHHLKANKYMRHAGNPPRELTGSQSLQLVLDLCGLPEEAAGGAATAPRSWVPYMEAINRLSKFGAFIKRNPLGDMPSEGVEELGTKLEELRGNIEPIARLLWPERFRPL